MDITVASFNVAGHGNDIKRKSIWHFLKNKHFDIILFARDAFFSC